MYVLPQAHKSHELSGFFAQLFVTAAQGRPANGGFQHVAVKSQVRAHHHVF